MHCDQQAQSREIILPQASRKGDTASGHGCFPSTSAIAGSADVVIDGIAALRKGDAVAPHGCGQCVPHGRNVSGGSPSVFVNGRPLARVGDGVNCGGNVAVGSGTVIADELSRPAMTVLSQALGVAPCLRQCMRDANRKGQAFVARDTPA